MVSDQGPGAGLIVVGSSNISKPALKTGIEWNLIGNFPAMDQIKSEVLSAFAALWDQSTVLTSGVVQRYASLAAQARMLLIPPEAREIPEEPKTPRPWQQKALEALAQIRAQGWRRALVAVATGLGKTWLAAFDAVAFGAQFQRRPREGWTRSARSICSTKDWIFHRSTAW